MGETQAEHACGAGIAVDGDTLHFGDGCRAVLHQRIVKPSAGERDGLAGNVGLVERADKTDHITLTATESSVLHHADVGRAGLQQVGIGIFEVADVLCHVARNKGTAALLRGRSLAFNLQGHQVERLAGQRAARRHSQTVGRALNHAELRARDGKRGGQGSLNLRLRGIASDVGGGVSLAQIGQAELVALAQGTRSEGDALHLVHIGDTACHGAHTRAGVAQAGLIDRHFSHIGLCQTAGEAHVQPNLAAVGLRRVVAHLHIARANAGQARQFGLHACCQCGAIGVVTDVACGLAVKREGEGARRHCLGAAQIHCQRCQIDPDQRATESDLVAARASTADLNRAVAAQGGVERESHRCRVGAVIQGGGGVSRAAVDQAQGKAACAAGLDVDFLDFSLRRARAQRGVGVTGARRRLAAKVELEPGRWQGLASQSTDKTHNVAVALAGVVVVERDFNIRHIGDTAGQALVERGIGRAHLAERAGDSRITTVNRTHFLGRAVDQEQFIFLDHLFSFENNAIGGRLTGTARLHLADAGSCRGRGGRGVTHQREALQLVHAADGTARLLHHAVGHEEDIVVACHRRRGKDDVVDFGQTGLGWRRRTDGHGHRGRFLTQCLQRDLLDLGHARVGRLLCAHGIGDASSLGGGGDVIDIDPSERADKFNGEAAVAVACDRDIACTHIGQLFKRSLQGHQERSGCGTGIDRDLSAARATRQRECAHQVQRHIQHELGIDLDGLFSLGRQGDALVDVHQHIAGLQGEVSQADKSGTGGCGLQAGETAAGVAGVGDQRQTKVQAAKRQADLVGCTAIDAGKSRHIMAADGDQLRVLDDRTVRQANVLTALFKRKATRDAEEAKQVDVEVAGGLDDLALAARHGQAQSVTITAGVNAHGSLALGGAAVLEAVVNDLVVELAGLIDTDLQARAGHCQTVNSLEGHRIGCRLQAGPGACCVGLAAEHGQTEIGTGELNANSVRAAAVDANKCPQSATPHRQRSHLHLLAVGQGHTLAGLFQRQKPLQGHKVEGVDVQVAAGAGQFAQVTITVQGNAAARPGEHVELAQAVVDHHIGGTGGAGNATVDLDTQVGGADGKVVNPDKSNRPSCGFEGGKAAPGGVVGQALGGQGQTKVNPLQRQAHGIGGAAVKAGEGINPAAADGEQIGGDFGGRFGQGFVVRQIAVVKVKHLSAFFNRKATAGLEETKHVQVQVARSTQQLALGTVHRHGHTATGAGGHGQRGLARAARVVWVGVAVVHHGARGGTGTVDLYRQRVGRHRQACHAHKSGSLGSGLQAGPTARGSGAAGRQRLTQQGQTKFNTTELKADGTVGAPIQTGKGTQVAATNTQGGGVGRAAVRQLDAEGCAGLVDGKVTFKLYKTKGINIQMTIGAQQFATRTVDVQRQTAGRAGEHGQIGLAGAVVHHAGVQRLAVDGQIEGTDLHGQPINPDKGGTAHLGLQTGPVARHLAGSQFGGGQRFAQYRQAQVDIGQIQTNRIGLAAIHAGKGI